MKNYSKSDAFRAEKDAYFAQLLQDIKDAETGLFLVGNGNAAPKDSGDPAGDVPSGSEGPGALISGALNANLTPSMLPFEDFVRGVCHIQHPFCD